MEREPVLKVRNLSKSFPGVKALDNVQFDLYAGEITALLGGNGAGKSTLIKCITGVYPSEEGSITLAGKPIRGLSAEKTQKAGISSVHQEVNLIPTLSVAENIYLGFQPYKNGRIHWAQMNQNARKFLADMNIELDVTQNLSEYSLGIQQMVAIARGIQMSAKVLILDEPTSSLDMQEANELFALMRRLKGQGIGIVFVTHFLDQAYEVCDKITVLRNGKYIDTQPVEELPQAELIRLMLGKVMDRQPTENNVRYKRPASAKPFLSAKKIGNHKTINPCNIDFYEGESFGLAGLLGSGRTELAKLLFGIDTPDTGEIYIQGSKTTIDSPFAAIQQGLAFCPEDRKSEGAIGELSVLENMVLALQAKRGWMKKLPESERRAIATKFVQSLNIVTSDINKPIKELSGGNQQKVILARWLASEPHLLILDEPTRGIDIGAKAEIMQITEQLCRQGMALMVISSDLDEVVEFSDRLTVLKDRHQVGDLNGDEINTENVMAIIARGKEHVSSKGRSRDKNA